jgi:malonyl-CoA decarboxylase
MTEERQVNFGEVSRKVAAAALGIFVKPEEKKVSEALSLLSGGQTIQSGAINTIRDYYKRGKEEKHAFFKTLKSLDPARIEIVLNEIYAALDSPRWLIEIREDLASLGRELKDAGDAEGAKTYAGLGQAIVSYFHKIFNFQYLNLRVNDMYNTSLYLLKFMAAKEGVHPTEHWWAFEDRLNRPDRFILSLEHFKMPSIPIVYVEVALTQGIVKKLVQITDPSSKVVDPAAADAAIFYSINSTLKGLGGAGLAEKMIILAKKHLERQYPRLKHFATLSPAPLFRSYLETVLSEKKHAFRLTRQKIDDNRNNRFFRKTDLKECAEALGKEGLSPSECLKAVLTTERWFENPALRSKLEQPLRAFLEYYLAREKRPEKGEAAVHPRAYDPVANFHFGNGAYLGGLNYLANLSERGMKESYGMMVNYIYEGKKLDENKLGYESGKMAVSV